MKILFINTFDRQGGASQSCWRTLQSLQSVGCETKMLVRDLKEAHPWVDGLESSIFENIKVKYLEIKERIRFIPQEASKRYRFQYSLPFYGIDISNHPWVQEADVLHLHWIHRSFLSTASIQKLKELRKPIVWSLHDMWAFTGGCHYAGACNHYIESCGNCFQLKNPNPKDLSNKIYNHKKENYPSLGIHYLASSNWLAEIARTSSLLKKEKVDSIPTPIDTTIFSPLDKSDSRILLNLPIDKKLILFVAMDVNDQRKGFRYLKEALQFSKKNLSINTEDWELVILGRDRKEISKDLPLNHHSLGFINSPEKIATAYNACDVFVMPTVEDNLPNTILESLACGVPTVAFATGGIPQMIQHKKNGYLAKPEDSQGLADGLHFVLNSNIEKAELSVNARETALEEFSFESVGNKYLAFYKSLL